MTEPAADLDQPQESGRGFWTPGRVLALIMLVALLIRVLATMTRSMIQFDETAYVRMAENLASGLSPLDVSGVTSTHFSPLLPLIIAAVAFVLQDYILSGYVVVIVFSTLILLPTYLLGKELLGERVGLMAAALMAVSPFFISTSEFIYSESVDIFFMMMALFFGWHMLHRRRLACGAAAGICLGFDYLARPTAVFYVVALLALASLVAWRRQAWLAMARSAGVMLAVFMVFAVPYVIFLHSETGRWTYSGKMIAGNTYAATFDLRRDDTVAFERELLTLNAEGTQVKVLDLEADPEWNNPINFIFSHPKQALKNFFKQTQILLTDVLQQLVPLWLLPLLGLGLFARGWSREQAAGVGYVAVMLSPALIILSMLAFPRFFMPYVPLVSIYIAAGWQRLEAWAGETVALTGTGGPRQRLQRLAPWLVGAAVLLPLLALAGAMVLRQDYAVEFKEAGEWVRQEAGAGQVILNREYSSAYYAGGLAVVLPYADYDDTTDYARLKDVDYLVISRSAIEELRPQLAVLLAEGGRHPDWELAETIRPGTDRETYIFRLVNGQREGG
ncbi:MAG: ArnT family glycosyltransferase [Thermoleophilia bacterium]